MAKRKKTRKRPKKALDTYLEKTRRGRPPKISISEVIGRAENYRKYVFGQIWEKIGEHLLKAESEEGVIRAFDETPYRREFEPLASLILQVLHEPDFLKRDQTAQVNFLADSLGARGELTPRSSRDICAREKAKEGVKSPYEILRYEYYVECSCGYKGPAQDNACRKCGAEIPFSFGGFGLA